MAREGTHVAAATATAMEAPAEKPRENYAALGQAPYLCYSMEGMELSEPLYGSTPERHAMTAAIPSGRAEQLQDPHWCAKNQDPTNTRETLKLGNHRFTATPPLTIQQRAINKQGTKILKDINQLMDDHGDKIQTLNDYQLICQGMTITPFSNIENNAPLPLYAGAFMASKLNQKTMWICKPCDYIVFRKNNFRTHHTSEKHEDNLQSWLKQTSLAPKDCIEAKQEIVNIPMDKNNSREEFERAIISIQTRIPAKHREETIKIVSMFFNENLSHTMEIDFLQEFKEAQDEIFWGDKHRHLINIKFEILQKRQDLRNYLKTKWLHRTIISRKSLQQKDEVKLIADVARILFAILVDIEFVPTNYLAMLAVVMNQRNHLNYPESAVCLSNGFYIDLFLNPGTIITIMNIEKIPILTENDLPPDLSRLFIKDHCQDMIGGNLNPEDDDDLLLQLPLMEDINEQIKQNNTDYQHLNPNEEWSLSQIISDDTTSINSASASSIPDLEISCSASTSSIPDLDISGLFSPDSGTPKGSPSNTSSRQEKPTQKQQHTASNPPASRSSSIEVISSETTPERNLLPDDDTIIKSLQIFNEESLQIISTQNFKVPPYSTIQFEAKLIKENEPEMVITEGKISVVYGPAPYMQIMDGIYLLENSLLIPSIRNNSSCTMEIVKGQIIQGTSCHLYNYVMDQVDNIEGGWSSFHLQAKTFQRINQFNDFSYRMDHQENMEPKLIDINPWMMEIDD